VNESMEPPRDSQAPGAEVRPDATTVLVVDDEASHLESIEKIIQREGMRALTAPNARTALELARRHRVHVVLTDLMMPGTSGIELLRAVKEISPDTEVVVMTAYGTVEAAVQAMREGAYDFIEKPLKRVTLVKSLRKAAERWLLLTENRTLKRELKLLQRREIVGNSHAMRRVLDIATQAAPSMATVLVLGESGTGKELIARFIHDQSARPTGPFVAVNCAAIPESILEAELFGHEKGAFTGAIARREGRFAKAAGGTLFLDEIAELSLPTQAKLLRALQEREVQPLGASLALAVDFRLVCATNRNLQEQVARGAFREDLYYRIAVVVVPVPPLRDRTEDIPALTEHILRRVVPRSRGVAPTLSATAMRKLLRAPWPGNVRQLENALTRATVLAQGEAIEASDIELPEDTPPRSGASAGRATFEQAERARIIELLESHRWNVRKVAPLLGLPRSTLYRKLARYGIAVRGRSISSRAACPKSLPG